MGFSHIDILRASHLFLKDKGEIALIFDQTTESALSLEILKRSNVPYRVMISPLLKEAEKECAHNFLIECAELGSDLIVGNFSCDNQEIFAATKESAKTHRKHLNTDSPQEAVKVSAFLDSIFDLRIRLSRTFAPGAWDSFKFPRLYLKFQQNQKMANDTLSCTRRAFVAKLCGGTALAGICFLNPNFWRSTPSEFITVVNGVEIKDDDGSGNCPGGVEVCHPVDPNNCWCN